MGFVLMAIGAAMIFLAIFLFASGLFGIILVTVGSIFRSFMNMLYHLFNHSRIDDSYVKFREEKIRAKEVEQKLREENDRQRRITENMNNLSIAVKRKVDEYKKTYYLADETLIDAYITAFTTRTMKETDEIAEKMKLQHETRMNNAVVSANYRIDDMLDDCLSFEKKTYGIDIKVYKYCDKSIVFCIGNGVDFSYATENHMLATFIATNLVKDVANKESIFWQIDYKIRNGQKFAYSNDYCKKIIVDSIHKIEEK